MKRKAYLPWDAAGYRSRTYAPRVTKVHGPLGEKHFEPVRYGAFPAGTTCQGCGYHVCSCERQKPEPREYWHVAPNSQALNDALHQKLAEHTAERLTRAQLYERAGYVTTPMPTEPTLCDAPVPPSQGPAGPVTLTPAEHAAMLARRGMTQDEWSLFVHAAADEVMRGLPRSWTVEQFKTAFHARIYAE